MDLKIEISYLFKVQMSGEAVAMEVDSPAAAVPAAASVPTISESTPTVIGGRKYFNLLPSVSLPERLF